MDGRVYTVGMGTMPDRIGPQGKALNLKPIQAQVDENGVIYVYMDVTHCSSARREYRLVRSDIGSHLALLTIRDQCDTLEEAKSVAAKALRSSAVK
jgi:hypothetical protein